SLTSNTPTASDGTCSRTCWALACEHNPIVNNATPITALRKCLNCRSLLFCAHPRSHPEFCAFHPIAGRKAFQFQFSRGLILGHGRKRGRIHMWHSRPRLCSAEGGSLLVRSGRLRPPVEHSRGRLCHNHVFSNSPELPPSRRMLPMRLPVVQLGVPRATGFETGPRSISAVRVLRISITDRCNFRCVYCMPEEGVRWLPREDILSFEEIRDVARAAIEHHGIRRFKLTGGEPTVRSGLLDLVRMLRRLDSIEDLSLTTNGMRLPELAQPLREAGLDRVTVSIDSLRPDRFRRITRTGDLPTVLRGLDAAEEAGLGLKINCVTMRGANDDEFVDFAKLTLDRKLTVRLIEYMPLGDAALLHADAARDTGLQPVR